MNNVDIRKYIINNFKNDPIDDIRSSIDKSISSHEEETLIGLGVLFELLWNNTLEKDKLLILNNIKRGL